MQRYRFFMFIKKRSGILNLFLTGLLLTLMTTHLPAQTEDEWLTVYERSHFTKTPRYEETIDYCRRLAAASDWVQFTILGTSPQGRELPLVILNKNGDFTPEAVRTSGQAVVLIQSCIHAGECDGKDASLMLMREIAITRKYADLLDHVTVLMIPIFNVDGHERFGPYNRINQNGPEEMGYRATAQRLNLNRDFLKADTPEMRAWLKLFNRWLPDFLVDNHVTDGFDHQYALTYGIEKDRTVAQPLREWTARVMEPYLQSRMAADGIPIFPYHRLKERPDLRKGITHFPFSPRYSTGYGVVQNRIFYLVETHALKDYRTRVTANYQLLKHILKLLNEQYRELMRVNRESDRLTAERLVGSYLPLGTRVNMSDSTLIDYQGVAFTITESDVSGGKWVQFGDEKKTYRLPFFKHTVVVDSARIPYAYIIPPEWQEQIELLKLHGVVIRRLREAVALPVQSYRFNQVHWAKRPFEGRLRLTFEAETVQEKRTFPAGSAVLLMNQRTNRVIAHLLEPNAPDSMLRWGMWNTIFERKEYAEDYKLEGIARKMLAENPGLWEEYQQAVRSDSSRYNNHWARLYFFYARTPYREQDVNLYPVGKLMKEQELPME